MQPLSSRLDYNAKFKSLGRIVVGKCEQAESKQGNPVLEILPTVGKLMVTTGKLFFTKNTEQEKKSKSKKQKKATIPTPCSEVCRKGGRSIIYLLNFCLVLTKLFSSQVPGMDPTYKCIDIL